MTPELQQRIVQRLAATGADAQDFSYLVLAALDGRDALDGYLAGGNAPPRPTLDATDTEPRPEPPGVYVGAITVEGFRGIGPKAMLALNPGPGLTLVVGRNGSGKSSFAEALEVLLTGTSLRWHERPKVWEHGWRNLHAPHPASVSANLLVDGQGDVVVRRAWPADAELEACDTSVTQTGTPARTLDALGWDVALETYRPFLSYNELGSMLDEGPSKLYDAISNVLGLDELEAVQRALGDARKAIATRQKEAKDAADRLALQAEAAGRAGDPRGAQLAALLRAKAWDLAALEALADSGSREARDALDGLRALTALQGPDTAAVATVVQQLRDAQATRARMAGTDAARSQARARLLAEALEFHQMQTAGHKGRPLHDGAGRPLHDGAGRPLDDGAGAPAAHGAGGRSLRDADAACPVCGATGALTAEWHARVVAEIAQLRAEAQEVQRADASLTQAMQHARRLVQPVPAAVAAAAQDLPSRQAAHDQWTRWAEGLSVATPEALAGHLEAHALDLAEVVRQLAREAADRLQQREDSWRPVALALAAWLPAARAAQAGGEHLKPLKAAEQWWKDTLAAVRDERFQPIAGRAMAIWQQLRLQSNVEICKVTLAGSATKRHVALEVTVDGAPAEAVGVMSQGELHSLALSLFLPRATLPESPFRFVCVDDPVQSMDPARVEGLARTLADVAKTRQVIVFTHDDRLPEAVRRLGLRAAFVDVTRRAKSVVELRRTRDPISGHLDDALALLKTDGLPGQVAARVVPGFCRLALEAACVDTVRRRRLAGGALHADLEELLAGQKLSGLMALALFDDATRAKDVLPRLNNKIGRWAGDAYAGCNHGAHEAHDGDLQLLVRDTEKLTANIRGLAA